MKSLLIFFTFTLGVSYFAQPVSESLSTEHLQSQHEVLKKKYFERRSEGYDLSRIDPLLEKLRIARSKKDHYSFFEALKEIEAALQKTTRPAFLLTSFDEIKPKSSTNIENFGFGIEYAKPGLASLFHGLGINWVRMGPIVWGIHEPNPPIGANHTYDWSRIDGRVREYQNAGFDNIQFVLSAKSTWASPSVSDASPESASPPDEENLGHYQTFIRKLVERYDGDGIDDMAGGRKLTIYLLVESEAYHKGFWDGTVEEYEELLKAAYNGAKEANSKSQIILGGINLADLFDDIPDHEQAQLRISELSSGFKSQIEFMKTSLSYKDYFDIVELHYNYDYRGLYRVIDWIRKEMRANGYFKPIWAGDAGAAPMLYSAFKTNSSRDGKRDFQILGNPRRSEHKRVHSWYRSEQAKNLVKKIIVAMEQGLSGINIGNMVDWEGYWGGKNWWYQGLLDKGKQPRPAFLAYKLLLEKVSGSTRVLRLGTDEGVFAYRFERPSNPVYVFWSETSGQTITLPDTAAQVFLSHTPVTTEQKVGMNYLSKKGEETMVLKLTSTPIFYESSQ